MPLQVVGPTALKARALALVVAYNHGDRKEESIDELSLPSRWRWVTFSSTTS